MEAAAFIELLAAGPEEAALDALAQDATLASARDRNGVSVVCLAVYRRRLQLTAALVSRREQLDIFEASCVGDVAQLERIVASDPGQVNDVSPDGFSPVGYAAFFGHAALLRRLIEAGGRVDQPAQNAMRVCPIHSAAASQQPLHALELTRLLFAAGADPNARQQAGFVALHEAARQGNLELCRYLIEHGADPTLATEAGERALDFARARGHAEVVAYLEQVRVT